MNLIKEVGQVVTKKKGLCLKCRNVKNLIIPFVMLAFFYGEQSWEGGRGSKFVEKKSFEENWRKKVYQSFRPTGPRGQIE